MSAGWVAGSVRARALARRRLGAGAARRLAACGSLGDALRMLAATPYGTGIRGTGIRGTGIRGTGIRREQPLAVAQHEVADVLLWDLRVLAGWLPRDGVWLLRILGAWFEMANVDELLQAIAGRSAEAEFRLGALATAWPRLRQAASHGDLRAALAASAWRDPGGETARAVRLGMRTRWAARVAELGDPARTWAAGAVALLVAGERFAPDAGSMGTGSMGTGSTGTGSTGTAEPAVMEGALRMLGADAARAATLGDLAGALPSRARWALAGITSPAGLWRAEAAVMSRVEQDGLRLLRTSGLGRDMVLGAVAVMACDAWRIRAALGLAARGGRPLEAYDELG